MDQGETWHGLGLGPGHSVSDGDPAPQKGHSPQFSAHVCCDQTAGWINMPHGTEVGIGPGDMDPAPPPQKKKRRGTAALTFRPVYCGQTAGWMKAPLGREVDLGPGDIV